MDGLRSAGELEDPTDKVPAGCRIAKRAVMINLAVEDIKYYDRELTPREVGELEYKYGVILKARSLMVNLQVVCDYVITWTLDCSEKEGACKQNGTVCVNDSECCGKRCVGGICAERGIGCGNGICSLAENYIDCPKDCTCYDTGVVGVAYKGELYENGCGQWDISNVISGWFGGKEELKEYYCEGSGKNAVLKYTVRNCEKENLTCVKNRCIRPGNESSEWVYGLMLPVDNVSHVNLTYTCGNDICEAGKGENHTNCPADCVTDYKGPGIGLCGDGECSGNESYEECPKDCECYETDQGVFYRGRIKKNKCGMWFEDLFEVGFGIFNTRLKEYYCEDGVLKSNNTECAVGYICKNGDCIIE